MDLNDSPSSIGSGGVGSSSVRKERGAIAAQACELCRTRKQRCDEARPKCSTCQRLGVECFYREPQPTKKDNSLQEILKKLTIIQKEVHDIHSRDFDRQSQELPLRPQRPMANATEETRVALVGYRNAPEVSADDRADAHHDFYKPSNEAMLKWPIMQHLSGTTGAQGEGIRSKSPPFPLIGAACIDESQQPLDIGGIASAQYSTGASTPASFLYSNVSVTHGPGSAVLGWDTVQPLTRGYFDTFNLLHPIVDEDCFMSDTVSHVFDKSDDTPASALAFLVLALGEVALAGNDAPISHFGGIPSGIRGGRADQPPGLKYFNEARRRLGLSVTEVSIENLQVQCLASLYYASCGRSGDCWRIAASASIICQALARRVHEAQPDDETIRRLFYHCAKVTFTLGTELHLPITNLEHLRTYVGLPDFAGGQSEEDYLVNHTSQIRDYSQSQILLHHIFVELYSSSAQVTATSEISGETVSTAETIRARIQYCNEQLEQWRDLLPRHLSWENGQFLGFSPEEHAAQTQLLIDHNLMEPNMTYPYITMMQFALVRSQYCLGKHLSLRYYVYKALHHPGSLHPDDYRGAAECLKASLKWPIAMTPPSMNKRLIPLPFYWSQNICGVLILLHLAQLHPMLSRIRTSFCGENFEYEAAETCKMYTQWLRDMKQICLISERCWNIVRPLYALQD